MSSAYHLIVSNYPVLEGYQDVGQYVMTFFREEDKRIFERMLSERNVLAWGQPVAGAYHEPEIAFEYHNTVRNVKDRLDVMGFTLERAKNDFDVSIEERARSQADFLEATALDKELKRSAEEELQIVRSMTFTDYIKSLEEILARTPPSVDLGDYTNSPRYSFIRLILSRRAEELLFLFGEADFRSALRALLEAGHDDAEVVLDLTEVFHAGYYNEEDNVCEQALTSFSLDYAETAKIIILAEGSSDIAFLEKSLKILFPHLYGYYAFMDFHTSKAEGSASALVRTIKAFMGSGIRNRVVAIFDNDTAAHDTLKQLKALPIPDNIKILTLPDLDFAKKYPTIGPYGNTPMQTDINGLALSIELFFGQDVLLDENGDYLPVQWKGYVEGSKKYQGEILHKDMLQDKYASILKQAQHPNYVGTHDWSAMNLLLQHIFRAFQ